MLAFISRSVSSVYAMALVAFCLFGSVNRALVACGPVPVPVENLDPNSLYDDKRVTKVEIVMDPMDWDQLRLQRRDFVDSMLDPSRSSFDTFRGEIRINGVAIPDVGIRKKGFLGSVDDDYPSLKIKLDEYVDQSPLGATKRLTLNNNKQDFSQLSQFLAYRLFNRVGVHAPRVGFASVFVNNKHLGVYSLVETVDKPFLSSRYQSSSGDLIEGTLADFSSKSLPRMDYKSGNSTRPSEWRANELVELLQTDELNMDRLKQLVDVDSFYRFWATESLLAFWDGYTANQNNFFVYDDPKTKRLYFMPWGADSLWSTMSGPFGRFGKPPAESVYTNSLLAHKIFKTEEGREQYRQTLTKVLEAHWDVTELKSKIDEVATLLEPHLHARQKGASQAQKEMKRFIENRRQRVEKELTDWPVSVPDKPRRAMYQQAVGRVDGDFSTFWQRIPKGESSTGNLRIVVDEKEIEFRSVAVTSKRFSMGFMTFGAPQESLPPTVEFNGKGTDGQTYVLTISFDNMAFRSLDANNVDKSVRIRGSLTKAGAVARGPMDGNMKWLQGTCELSEASTTSGAPVIGKFNATLSRLVGGFFGG